MIICFDITNIESFDNIRDHIEEVDKSCNTDPVLMIVGNKADQKDDRKVSTEEAKKLANDFYASYMEVSAKTAVNVESAFFILENRIK